MGNNSFALHVDASIIRTKKVDLCCSANFLWIPQENFRPCSRHKHLPLPPKKEKGNRITMRNDDNRDRYDCRNEDSVASGGYSEIVDDITRYIEDDMALKRLKWMRRDEDETSGESSVSSTSSRNSVCHTAHKVLYDMYAVSTEGTHVCMKSVGRGGRERERGRQS